MSCGIWRAALSLIPPLLADNVRREAEHFLEILETIHAELANCSQSPVIHCDDKCMELPVQNRP